MRASLHVERLHRSMEANYGGRKISATAVESEAWLAAGARAGKAKTWVGERTCAMRPKG
jgi:hypothetical protein